MKLIVHKNFFNTLKENPSDIIGYNQLDYNSNNKKIFDFKDQESDSEILNKVVSVMLFPSYFAPRFSNKDLIKFVKIPQKKITGYSILLDDSKNIEDFIKTAYSSRYRNEIKRYLIRFETCFNANYKMFFGTISKDEYDILMKMLHSMLIARFNQRNDRNKILENWHYYLKIIFSLINSKKASLFVIYNGIKPVQICINFHFNNMLFISISSYDIDYEKFSMGNNAIFKLLEWSINNGYSHLDLEYGYLPYKRRWSNHIYSYDHHIIYPKNNYLLSCIANLEIGKIHAKNLFKTLNFDDYLKKIKGFLKRKRYVQTDMQYKIEILDKLDTNQLNNIQANLDDDFKIKKPLFDFLYNHKEHINSLKIFKCKSDEYYIVGRNVIEKINIL